MKYLSLFLLVFCCACHADETSTSLPDEVTPATPKSVAVLDCDTIRPTSMVDADNLEPYRIHEEKPDETVAYHLQPGRKLVAKGYWHDAEILIQEAFEGKAGYRLFKAFSYVREPNPSLGWPAWQAFDAILVNVGWIPFSCATKDRPIGKSTTYTESADIIQGRIALLNEERRSSALPSALFDEGRYDVHLLWDLIGHQIRNSDLPPCGINLLPLCIDLSSIPSGED